MSSMSFSVSLSRCVRSSAWCVVVFRDRAISCISEANFSSNLDVIFSNLETVSSIDGPGFSSMSPQRVRNSDVGGLS